jgi:glycosyltransferase involved in cell wall biosynthesis
MNLKGKKLLICEEALIDYNGHFYTWIKAIRQMHMDVGAEVLVAGSKQIKFEIKESMGVIPVYSINSWDQTASSKWPAWRRYFRVFAHNWRIFQETKCALKKAGPVDVVLFTAARVHHLVGLRLLCAWGLGRHFQKMVIFLLTSQAEYNDTYTNFHFKRSAALIRRSIQWFNKQVINNQVILAGDSHITCKEYEIMTGVPMTLFPSPGGSLQYLRQVKSAVSCSPVFAILGVSGYDKGIDIFQQAVLKFLGKFPESEAKFVFQWGAPCITPQGRIISIDGRMRAARQVTLIEDRLTDEEYSNLFTQADIFVLPYRKSTYINRISGVAVEAACSGKFMIVTENTWLSWAIKEFAAGIENAEDDSDNLAYLIEKCCADWSSMADQAKRRMKDALDYNSSSKYLKLIWSF